MRYHGWQVEAQLLVRVDQDKCQGHNRCYSIAPGLFELDDLGTSSAIGSGEVPAGLEAAARRAEANCPEHAVLISDGLVPDGLVSDG
jgi:ferredoxin